MAEETSTNSGYAHATVHNVQASADRVKKDLASSGLTQEDIYIRPLEGLERASTNVPHSVQGYVIPYFGLDGKPAKHYRVKLFDFDPKYKQPKESANHLYFPKGFLQVADKHDYVILTEGEKKACLALKMGYPACSVGGVDSWRNRVITLPKDSELNSSKNDVRAKLPSGSETSEDIGSILATGLQELIDYVLAKGKTLIIVYDSDGASGTNHNVQRAAASLGYELRFRGLPFKHIRQIVLPLPPNTSKVGLDDFLLQTSPGTFDKLLKACLEKKSAFPRHPNVKDFLNKRLQKAYMSRKDMQSTAIAVISELDAVGMRLRSKGELQSYFFDAKTHKLIKVSFTGKPNEMTESEFGYYVYHNYGIGAADHRLMQWIGTQFTGEEPILEVEPHRVIGRKNLGDDSVCFQLSDAKYAVINADGLTIKDNGSGGMLFESGHVKPLDHEKLVKEFKRQEGLALSNWWMDVLGQVRLKDMTKQRCITALLFYMTPWLYRWRGIQLPAEMTLGEAGSGKSTLQEFRLNVLTGEPKLRNSPKDLADWHASVANSGGLHVIDNVQLLNNDLRQRISDEMCRIITAPDPTVEMRKYYTNAELMSLPVKCVFGITAIKQPFQNQDIIQRSWLIELDKTKDVMDGTITYDGFWKEQQMSRFGGREAWVAHHLHVLQVFFRIVKQTWNMKYQAKNRLINFEQSLLIMSRVFGIDGSWIPNYLVGETEKAISDSDFAFEGLKTFASVWREHGIQHVNGKIHYKPFTVQDISNWAMADDEYEQCEILINTRKLGRYLKTHMSMVVSATGIIEDGMYGNRQRYKIVTANKG